MRLEARLNLMTGGSSRCLLMFAINESTKDANEICFDFRSGVWFAEFVDNATER